MANCRIIISDSYPTNLSAGSWKAVLSISSGLRPSAIRDYGGAITNAIPGVIAEAREEVRDGAKYVALVLSGPWELLKFVNPSDSYIQWRNVSGSAIPNQGYPKLAMLWGCNKSGDRWVFPEWAVNSPAQNPLTAHLASYSEAGYLPDWFLHHYGSSGSAVPNGPLMYACQTGMSTVTRFPESTIPQNGADIPIESAYFRPTVAIKLYDNGVYVPAVDANAIPAPPPPTITASTAGATGTDVAALESRLVALQSSLGVVVQALSQLPTATELRELMGQRAAENRVVNESVSAVGNYMVDQSLSQPSTTRRLAEMALTGAIANLLTK